MNAALQKAKRLRQPKNHLRYISQLEAQGACPLRCGRCAFSASGFWENLLLLLLLVALLAVGAVAGCRPRRQSVEAEKQPAEPNAARSDVERGPVRVSAIVEPARIRLSDEPTLTLRIDYKRGVAVRKPPFGESLGEFLVRGFREPLPRSEGDREIIEQIYRLEPTRTGKLSVWPITVAFVDSRPDGDGKEHTIQTEALSVEVASVVDAELPSLEAIKPVAGPVELPEDGATGVWWLIALAVLASVLAGVGWLLRRRSRVASERPLSPQEQAYLELQRLLEEDLAARDVKLFYVELTAVVRRYIERTTGIRAPEQTTEEFLREISRRDTFSPEESQRLRHFLESADLVKFAAHQPRREDIEASFSRAKVFIGLERMEVAA